MKFSVHIAFLICLLTIISCGQPKNKNTTGTNPTKLTAEDILGNPEYLAISYGGYRKASRDEQPSLDDLKEDLKIMHAMGIRILRTYNVHLPHASNVLKAIKALQEEDPAFDMYVMLGAWMDCKNAWTDQPVDHTKESERNSVEIETAVNLANEYPDIIKIIAVGNEAMVKWATSYYVVPGTILKWVVHLQELKKSSKLPQDIWITSSDNFASWGGGTADYHVEDLEKLIGAVDYISMHTYPMHDTHYNPAFWGITSDESNLSKIEKIEQAMTRASQYAENQYRAVKNYMESLGIQKPIHIGETGWASYSNGHYGNEGSKATDEYKQALYYNAMRAWTAREKMACFYFEAFDEKWKDANNPGGSENHFGLITIDGKAKYALWPLVDKGIFNQLTRNGHIITKTYDGDFNQLQEQIKEPPLNKDLIN